MQIAISTAYGVSCAVAAFFWAVTHRKDQRIGKVLYSVLGIALMYSFAFPLLLKFEDSLVPWKYDALLYRLDGCLGVSVEGYLRILPHSLSMVFTATYQALLWVITIWGCLHLTQKWGNFRALVTAFITGYAVVGFLYLIVPACAPAYTPIETYRTGSIAPTLLHSYPNAMPSMHVASALILVLFAGPSRGLRAFSILFLIGTCFGTVLGEHYFVDWAGSIPFACFAVAVGLREKRKAAIYLIVTLALLLLIRFAGPILVEHRWIFRLLVVAMLGIGVEAVYRAWRCGRKLNAASGPILVEKLVA